MATLIDLILQFGSLAGLFSLIYVVIKDYYRWKKSPKLKIACLNKTQDIRVFNITGLPSFPIRKFVNMQIRNKKRNITARGCIATIKFIKKPSNVTHLEREYTLHWADIPYSGRTTGSEPVDIISDWRLDAVFTCQNQTLPGCWIAIPNALLNPNLHNQTYLPPGEYKVRIDILCDNGKGDFGIYIITSPDSPINWQNLDCNEDLSLRKKLKLLIEKN
jgi:hypothetical protein